MADGINLYEDLKRCIEENFAFLKRYGFGDFEEQQIAFEIHSRTKSNFTSIDIWFEMTFETPVWVTVNGYYTSLLEPDNPLDLQYADKRVQIYRDDKTGRKSGAEQYTANGRLLNEAYLQDIANLLQKYPEVLMGDVQMLKVNFAAARAERETQQAAERIEKQIYTCYFTIGGGIECEEEARSLEEMKRSLTQFENPSIKVIKVVDCYMNPVPFSWP